MAGGGRALTTIQTGADGKTTTRQSVPVVPREQTDDRAINQIQRNMEQSTAAARSAPESQGSVVFKGQVFAAGVAKTIVHKLGRKFTRVQVFNPVGGYLAWQVIANTPSSLDSSQVMIQCQNAVTADVEVS